MNDAANSASQIAHAPLPCPTCRVNLPFTEYGHKVGKNGKPAKWPIYKKCKNPDCRIGRKNLGVPETDDESFKSVPLALPKPGPHMALYQLSNRVNPPLIFDDMYDAIDNRPGMHINMGREDIAMVQSACKNSNSVTCIEQGDNLVMKMGGKTITLSPAAWKMTKGYGYFSVVEDK